MSHFFQVASEHFYFWLIALKFFCEAESLLSVPCDSQIALAKQISDACAKYHKGITTLKVQPVFHFSNSLKIHQVKTKKIITVKEVWIPGLN